MGPKRLRSANRSSPVKSARIDSAPADLLHRMQSQLKHAETQCSLDSHDLLTILICNEAFVQVVSLPALSRLPCLAKRYAGILSFVGNNQWIDKLYSHLGLTKSIFDSVPSIDPRAVLEGVCSFLSRKNDLPRSLEAYQRELQLWWALARSPALKSRLSAFLYQAMQESVVHHCHCTAYIDPSKLQDLDPAQKFRLIDASNIMRETTCGECTNESIFGETYRIIRFDYHPFHTKAQAAGLLPHEYALLLSDETGDLTLIDCSFASLSGWPELLAIHHLAIVRTACGNPIQSLEGMPLIPNLTRLTLPDSLTSLSYPLEELEQLDILDLSACAHLTSLEGLSPLSGLTTLRLPASISTFEILPHDLEALSVLDLGECTQLTSLVGLPLLPSLESFRLPRSIESLDGMPAELKELRTLDMLDSCRLKSLKGLPPLPRLIRLKLPKSNQRLSDIWDWIHCVKESRERNRLADQGQHSRSAASSLRELWMTLPLSGSDALCGLLGKPAYNYITVDRPEGLSDTLSLAPKLDSLTIAGSMSSLDEFCQPPSLPADEDRGQDKGADQSAGQHEDSGPPYSADKLQLESLVLPASIESLDRVPKCICLARQFDLSACSRLRSANGLVQLERMSTLTLSASIGTLEFMPNRLDLIKSLTIEAPGLWSLKGMAAAPLLCYLSLVAPIKNLEGLPSTFPSLNQLDLAGCAKLESFKGFPTMPKLESLYLPSTLKSIEGLPPVLDSVNNLSLQSCFKLTSLRGLPNMPRIRLLSFPPCLERLDMAAVQLESLERLDMRDCNNITLLDGLPQTPQLSHIILPRSLLSLQGLPMELTHVTELDLGGCVRLKSLVGFPAAPSLKALVLSTALEDLQGLPQSLPALQDLRFVSPPYRLSRLKSLRECPHLSQVSYLELHSTFSNFSMLPPSLDSVTTLSLKEVQNLASTGGLPDMPKLSRVRQPKNHTKMPVFKELGAIFQRDGRKVHMF
ncbi:uncharacterized protein BJ171DRAFT_506836 [Polychytrium aggregatum]|uniref:uncharacterized protein n=1 Tax=Polychytrium aggregatum TaxID=110093 RepID=UPI0022FE56C7|nr:uncharacterized protein BJ171DRAFT_506836 [Polychytrium aggregatum]KAI9204280.1 hypothetical protein BJ171DRAFT_506836 [Polychytrium aggregatum]